MFKCPVCGEKSFSGFEKWKLVPRIWRDCKSCGNGVTVNPFQYYSVQVISLTALLLSIKFIQEPMEYGVVSVIIVLSFLLNYKWVSLIQKK